MLTLCPQANAMPTDTSVEPVDQWVNTLLASEIKNGCPACSGRELDLGKAVSLTLVTRQVERRKSSPMKVEHYVPVTCADCGHVILIRASDFGLTPSPKPVELCPRVATARDGRIL
jgi:hypothetical protein